MSLRIKLPAVKPPLLPSPSSAVMEWSERKRKRTKRYLSSDEEFVAETDSVSAADYSRGRDTLVANSDIDEVGEEEHEQDDQRFNHTANKPTKSKAMAAASHGPPARKKSRRAVTYDPETDNEYLDVVGDSGHEFEDEDENDYLPTDPKPAAKGPKAKGKPSATTSAKGVAKRRAKVDNTSEVPDAGKKRPKLTPKADEVSIDVVGDSSSTPNVSTAGDHSIHAISRHDSPPPPPTPALPKKQKLPTIKKVKLANHNTSTSSSTTVVIDTTAAVLPVLPLGSKPIQDGVRKTLNGTIDIDLSNKSIYEEIFSKTGQGDGGTPRAGGNRRTKEEERRKELNRQRDEAKAKRSLEARQTFDLQSQFDRISRFEEKLKVVQSSALFPNFLAAKWRQEWEKGKRRQKGHDSNYSQGQGCTTREDGEVR